MKILIGGMSLLLLISFSFFLSVPVKAEDTTNTISIYPAIIETKLDPGSKQQQSITIYNKEDKSIAIRAYAQNFSASDEFGGMTFNNDTDKEFSASTWLELKSKNLVIGPKSKTDLKYTIDIPTEAEPGGHYSTIFFEYVNSPEISDNSAVGISERVGALLFITVNGQILEKGRVLGANSSDKCSGVQCSFKTARFRQWGPVPFEFRFENTGNIHVKVKGKIEIYNLVGIKVGEIAIDEKTVLPKSTRFFDSKWLREPLFGYYTAKLTLNYGTLGVTEKARTSFVALPWQIILIFTLFVLFFVFISKWRKSRRFRSRSRQHRREKRAKANKNGVQN